MTSGTAYRKGTRDSAVDVAQSVGLDRIRRVGP